MSHGTETLTSEVDDLHSPRKPKIKVGIVVAETFGDEKGAYRQSARLALRPNVFVDVS